MNDLYGLFRILFIHQYGYLNLAGGYHVDINVGVVESSNKVAATQDD